MKKVAIVLLSLAGAAAVLYGGFAAWLRIDGRFPFHTELNGHDVSLQRALDVQDICMDGYYPNMRFSIKGRDGLSYQVTPGSFDFSGAERAVSFLPEHTLLWPGSLFSETELSTHDGGAIKKLATRIEADSAFSPENMRPPQDAYVAYSAAEGRYVVVSETGGSIIDREKFEQALERHILRGSGSLDLENEGVYLSASVPASAPELVEACEKLNRFLDAEVVFSEGGVSRGFSVKALQPYLTVNNDPLEIVYDAAAATAGGVFAAFVGELAEAFDSNGAERDFITHDGQTVTVTEKTWFTKLDTEATSLALASMTFDALSAEEAPQGELFWERAPLDRLTDYVEVDLTNQTLYLYTGGELVLETPIVSGCVAQRHTTPAGAFSLIGKHRNVTLRGPGYASFVRYWMPFNNKIGLHDASWRSRFGGTIYQTNGSHGCINMPRDIAQTVFETIDGSYAIVCYWRPVEEV
ncbi:MAG: L,D-transpeptidase [Oscillospiraceae bacterium]|nr:L,D-transpeptidase [Oscillospiraceae bacterium]